MVDARVLPLSGDEGPNDEVMRAVLAKLESVETELQEANKKPPGNGLKKLVTERLAWLITAAIIAFAGFLFTVELRVRSIEGTRHTGAQEAVNEERIREELRAHEREIGHTVMQERVRALNLRLEALERGR